jgi:hypothetical protein
LKLSTRAPFETGDSVFVWHSDGYVHGIVKSKTLDLCTLAYYTDVDSTGIPTQQPLTSVFSEYFEHGKTVTVGLFENKVYRWVQSIQDGYITWWDNSQTLAGTTATAKLSLVRPIEVKTGQDVFVLSDKDANGFVNDNYFLWGTVTQKLGNGLYQVNYDRKMPPGSQTASTQQSILAFYLLSVP